MTKTKDWICKSCLILYILCCITQTTPLSALISCSPACPQLQPTLLCDPGEKTAVNTKLLFFLAEQFLSFGHFGWTKPANVEEYFILWSVHSTEKSVWVFVICGSFWVPSWTRFRNISVQFQLFNLNLCSNCYTQKAKLGIRDMGDIILKFSCFLFSPHVGSL